MLSKSEKVDALNIGLIVLSGALAMFLPFELFLFSYAVLGPLHYLTEINWLHQRKYFTTNKNDYLFLILLAIFISIDFLAVDLGLKLPVIFTSYSTHFVYIAFLGALILAFIKSNYLKIVCIGIVVFSTILIGLDKSNGYILFFSLYLPTIIHVFVFTAIFMLFGSLKSKSKLGYLAVALLFIVAAIMILSRMPYSPVMDWEYIKSSYVNFSELNRYLILNVFHAFDRSEIAKLDANTTNINQYLVYSSKGGYAIMRFIAFAYTYHYLNWFSKTSIIQWHKVSKPALGGIIAIWITSLALYAYNYTVGLKWLFLLSFMHVMLEFPLNFKSFVGIFQELFGLGKNVDQPIKASTRKAVVKKAK